MSGYSWEYLLETWGHETDDAPTVSDVEIERVKAEMSVTDRSDWYAEDGHRELLSVVVSFPITTDQAPATVTVRSDGTVRTAFGGTGI